MDNFTQTIVTALKTHNFLARVHTIVIGQYMKTRKIVTKINK